jgi:hypothetical protein
MIWVMRFLEKYQYTPMKIECGGYHNMLLIGPVRQVKSAPPTVQPGVAYIGGHKSTMIQLFTWLLM